jgi:hypothetical protein
MFRALLSHPQEVLYQRHLVYCVRVMSIGCYQGWNGTEFRSNPGSNIPNAAGVEPPEDEQVILETCRGP